MLLDAILDSRLVPGYPREVLPRLSPVAPIHPGRLVSVRRSRHQRRHIAPQVERPEVPPRPAHPWLRAPDVLDHHRDMPPRRLACLPLNPETRVEQSVVRRRKRLCPRPRHGAIAVRLTWRRRHDQRRVPELRTMERENVLNGERRRIAMRAVFVPLDIEPDHVIALGKQPVRPSAEPAKKIDRQRLVPQIAYGTLRGFLHCFFSSSCASHSRRRSTTPLRRMKPKANETAST